MEEPLVPSGVCVSEGKREARDQRGFGLGGLGVLRSRERGNFTAGWLLRQSG